MSGHNKWSSIKHKKAKSDAVRGKAFSRVSKELMLAAKIGGKDPLMNPRLRSAISAAKAVNMPSDNVERAIKRGCGELGDTVMEELTYEGYAPAGVAVIVECLTDNRNRTAAEVRTIFNKRGASMANSGSVVRFFKRKARFVIEGPAADDTKLMELCFDAGVDVDDITVSDGVAEIIAPPESFDALVKLFEKANITVTESKLARIPETEIPIGDPSTAKKVLDLLDELEEFEDVQAVYANADIPMAILEHLSNET